MDVIGRILDYRYEVLEKIGDGELFSVYKARDKVLNRLVAVRVPTRAVAENAEFVSAVLAAYSTVAALDHPNIARVYEADSTAENKYIACEYARGVNVKERIQRAGAVSVPLALDIAIAALEGIEYAHANRIVHGDLRPQDIVVSPDGEVKVTDFGLSTALRACPDVANAHAMRSIHYQAPEITEGNAFSVASDIYSMGVILYEMLTATLPFEGVTPMAIALKHAKDIPNPPRSINTAIPKSLNDLVMRAMDKDPEDRFANASAMLADLRAIRDALRLGKPLSIPQPSISARQEYEAEEPREFSAKKSFAWLMTLFVIVVLLGGAGAYFFTRSKGGTVTVPPLLGKTWEEAQYIAKEHGIRLVNEGDMFSDEVEAGRVASVVPPANSEVPVDDPVVRIKLSKGSNTELVPNLSGLSEGEATEKAASDGFAIGKVTEEYSDTVPAEAVISQNPISGVRRAPGSAIDLRVSLGPKPEQEPAPSETTPQPTGQSHRYTVSVEVPSDAPGPQEVKITVTDDQGERIAYQEYHDPGDKISEPVTTYGSSPRIQVYVDGNLVSDDTY